MFGSTTPAPVVEISEITINTKQPLVEMKYDHFIKMIYYDDS